jgi:subtilisin family serine protease
MIHLTSSTLADLQNDPSKVKSEAARREAALLTELGTHAWKSGRWRNEVGQIELYLTESGIDILSRSNQALNFWPGRHWSSRLGLDASDYRVASIEQELKSRGRVSVAALPHVSRDADYELTQQGQIRLSGRALLAAQQRLSPLLETLDTEDREFASPAAAESNLSQLGVPIRLDRKGLLQLLDTASLRSLAVAGLNDPRPLSVDPEALQVAEERGHVEVIVTLRNPLIGAFQQRNAVDAQVRAHRTAFKELRTRAQIPDTVVTDLPLIGAFTARLTAPQLNALVNSRDGRLLHIAMNRPRGQLDLALSTNTLNMPVAWNAGYRGAGQTLVVIDSGVRRNHPFFRDATGASRVVFEACFGSNGTVGGVQYQSRCPSPNALGDSPLGLAGSAAPVPSCSSISAADCSHGTHVSGIAAGRAEPSAGAGNQGTAPDAAIVAVQVMSYDVAGVARPRFFDADLVAALEAVVRSMQAGAANPYTVNLSLGGGSFSSSCPGEFPAITNAFRNLRDLGVPVIAAAGNAGLIGAIGFPACVPNAIKVSSHANDGVGNTLSSFSNLPRPSNFAGETIWLAPGGGNGTGIFSSFAFTPAYDRMSGTSQAAPHIAGLYSAAKAALPGSSVDQVSNWFRGNAAVPLNATFCNQSPCVNPATEVIHRIRLR